MKPFLKYVMFITVLVMLVIGTFAPKPKDAYKISPHELSLRTSGLPPNGRLLLFALFTVVFACVLVLFLYLYKLDNSLTCENDILRLRRYCRIYHYLLLIAGIISVTRIILAIFGLSTIQHIKYTHILHSGVWEGLAGLFLCVGFFLFTRKYIKSIQTVSPSVILAAKRKDCP